jgi:hypothetical protein
LRTTTAPRHAKIVLVMATPKRGHSLGS